MAHCMSGAFVRALNTTTPAITLGSPAATAAEMSTGTETVGLGGARRYIIGQRTGAVADETRQLEFPFTVSTRRGLAPVVSNEKPELMTSWRLSARAARCGVPAKRKRGLCFAGRTEGPRHGIGDRCSGGAPIVDVSEGRDRSDVGHGARKEGPRDLTNGTSVT